MFEGFPCLYDSATGLLYEIYSPDVDANQLNTTLYDIKWLEDQYSQVEAYNGFVKNDTVLSFYGLFKNKVLKGIHCIEISAILVDYVNKAAKLPRTKPFWILTVRDGIYNDENSEKAIAHYLRRSLFDAKTGEVGESLKSKADNA